MTREDVQELLAMIASVFVNYKPPNRTVAINAWWAFLKPFEKEKVFRAFQVYCTSDTTGFAPVPAQIIKIMHEMTGEIGELEAWAIVRKATSNGIYHAEEEFMKLPEVIRRAVGRPENIREWAMKDSSEVETVIMSQFLRAYRTERERAVRANLFPEFKGEAIEAKAPELLEDKEAEKAAGETATRIFEETMKKLQGLER